MNKQDEEYFEKEIADLKRQIKFADEWDIADLQMDLEEMRAEYNLAKYYDSIE